MDNTDFVNLYLQTPGKAPAIRTLLVGEVLWDQFPDSRRLGGAPLNVAVHLKRWGHEPRLVSVVGRDAPGDAARQAIGQHGLDPTFLQSTARYPTGRATVHLGPGDQTSFRIDRPAAYDALALSDADLRRIVSWNPAWFYYGTLFPSRAPGRRLLGRLLDAVPRATRFYDLNLRPGFQTPALVHELLQAADVVKLNERELRFVHERLELPSDPEGFCLAGAERYRWRAVCVTLGSRGCAMAVGGEYVQVAGLPVSVVDPVGAGDAFAAAFLHGLVLEWPVARVAEVSNRAGAQVVGSRGAIPAWVQHQVQP